MLNYRTQCACLKSDAVKEARSGKRFSTCVWFGIFGKGSQSVDGVDDKVFLQGEVGQAHRLWAVNHKHNVQRPAAFLTVCKQKHTMSGWDSLSEH